MTRVFSGIQPTGDMQLGNYLGAVRHWVEYQEKADALFCVVDLHALTVEQDPAALTAATRRKAIEILAAGIDPKQSTLFVQSHVAAHTELAWLLECTAAFGELRRMTQFKDKASESVSVGFFAYPCLMAADILLYDTNVVPVGDDQRQHLELTRDVAIRWNSRYGDTFVVPEASVPTVAARVMDLQDPTAKMSKSRPNPQGRVDMLDEPEVITRKIKRAVTDTDSEVRYEPATKPGVSNLIDLLAVATGSTPADVAARYTQYGPLKADAAAAIVEYLRPFQSRFRALEADPAYVDEVLRAGRFKAANIAARVLDRARSAIGLVPPINE